MFTYMISFAVILLIVVALLQNFFIDFYYESMKEGEINRIGSQIEQEINVNAPALDTYIVTLARADDIYVVIENRDGKITHSPDFFVSDSVSAYYKPYLEKAKAMLYNSNESSISLKLSDNDTSKNTLAYAKIILKSTGDYNVMYIFSPLYPVSSTLAIFRAQFIYIVVITLVLSLLIAYFISRKVTKPINKMTDTAAEMANGNYSINFETGSFTEIDALADTLNTAAYELDKTETYRKDLIANVSHDLKTPLTMIRSYGEMIRDLSGDNPEKRTKHIQVIIDESDRLNQLVSDMLSVSRFQAGKIVLEKEVFKFNDNMKSIMESYKILEQDGYKFKLELPRTNYNVKADKARINQVITNFVNNAIKYGGDDKEVIIRAKRINNKLRVEIEDHGPGIAKEDLKHVWERYYQASANHARVEGSSGLGLNICKEILNLHKFKLGVTSKLGKGTTFWFEMNIVKAQNN